MVLSIWRSLVIEINCGLELALSIGYQIIQHCINGGGFGADDFGVLSLTLPGGGLAGRGFDHLTIVKIGDLSFQVGFGVRR